MPQTPVPAVSRSLPSAISIALALVTTVLAIFASVAESKSIPAPHPEQLGTQPVGQIDDVVLESSGNRARAASWSAPAGASGGVYQAGGMAIRIYVSPAYAANPSLNQSWANFFASLPQYGDAATMTVYFVTQVEMRAICSDTAAACYDPNDNLLILTGEATAIDGTPIVEVAAHEFGHHIANHRSNDPWSAFNWGPKRWASIAGVCPGVLNDELFPNSEDADYDYALDPGEGWAEAYRVSAGGNASDWGIVSSFFMPDGDEREAALEDARRPALENEVRTWSRRFARRRSTVQVLRVATYLDGRFDLRLRSSRGLDVDLYVFDQEGDDLIARSRRYGRNEKLNTYVCGDNYYFIAMKRASRRTGSYRMSLNWAG